MGEVYKFKLLQSNNLCSIFVPTNYKWEQLTELISIRLNYHKQITSLILKLKTKERILITNMKIFKECIEREKQQSDLIFIINEEEEEREVRRGAVIAEEGNNVTQNKKKNRSERKERDENNKITTTPPPPTTTNKNKLKSAIAKDTNTKGIYFQYEMIKQRIEIPENSSWEELQLRIQNNFENLLNRAIQSFVLLDEEGDRISSVIDNSTKFWKFQIMYSENQTCYFNITTTTTTTSTSNSNELTNSDTTTNQSSKLTSSTSSSLSSTSSLSSVSSSQSHKKSNPQIHLSETVNDKNINTTLTNNNNNNTKNNQISINNDNKIKSTKSNNNPSSISQKKSPNLPKRNNQDNSYLMDDDNISITTETDKSIASSNTPASPWLITSVASSSVVNNPHIKSRNKYSNHNNNNININNNNSNNNSSNNRCRNSNIF